MPDKRHQISQEDNTDESNLYSYNFLKLYLHPSVCPALVLLFHGSPVRYNASERAFAVWQCTEILE